jgi:hypothetical protein
MSENTNPEVAEVEDTDDEAELRQRRSLAATQPNLGGWHPHHPPIFGAKA